MSVYLFIVNSFSVLKSIDFQTVKCKMKKKKI